MTWGLKLLVRGGYGKFPVFRNQRVRRAGDAHSLLVYRDARAPFANTATLSTVAAHPLATSSRSYLGGLPYNYAYTIIVVRIPLITTFDNVTKLALGKSHKLSFSVSTITRPRTYSRGCPSSASSVFVRLWRAQI